MNPPINVDATAGLSVILAVHDDSEVTRIEAAWRSSLEKLGIPFELVTVRGTMLGPMLRDGIESTTYPWLSIIVPEFPYRPSALRQFVDATEQSDLALGVRPGIERTQLGRILQNIKRKLGRILLGIDSNDAPQWYGFARWWRHLRLRVRYGLRVQDADCGLRLIRRELLDRCPIQSEGSFALVEMIAKMNFVGGSVIEVPAGRAGDLPTVQPFADVPEDEKHVFRHPSFSAKKIPEANVASGTGESS